MNILVHICLVAWSTQSVLSAQIFCVGDGCRNITLYLGPKFGSKTLHLDPTSREDVNSTTEWRLRAIAENTTVSTARRIKFVTTTAAPWPRYPKTTPPPASKAAAAMSGTPKSLPMRPIFPGHRPLLPGTKLDMGENPSLEDFDTSPRLQLSQEQLESSLFKGSLNLSAIGLDGLDVKLALANLTTTSLSSVRRLYLTDNRIRSLPVLSFPVELEYSLTQLWLDNNPITYLTATTTAFEISRLARLKVLGLSNTSLSFIGSLYLPNLEVLYLNDNHLTTIPMGLHGVTELHLANNHISSIIGSDMSGFYGLKVLDLSGNRISFIFDKPFMSLYRLERLYLNNNSLVDVLDLETETSVVLYLGDNPFMCSCRLVSKIGQPWPYVADKDDVTCIDGPNSPGKQSVNALAKTDSCKDPWGWWWDAGEKLEGFAHWLRRWGVTWQNIGNVLYWVLLVLGFFTLKALLQSRKRKEDKPLLFEPSNIPYSILDDKSVHNKENYK